MTNDTNTKTVYALAVVDPKTGATTAKPVSAAEFAKHQAERKAEKTAIIGQLSEELAKSGYIKSLTIQKFADEVEAITASFGADFNYTSAELAVMADLAALHLSGKDQDAIQDEATAFGLATSDFANRVIDLRATQKNFMVIAIVMKRIYAQNVNSYAKPEALASFLGELRDAAAKSKGDIQKIKDIAP